MKKEIIYTQNAPNPVGPYSQAVKLGDMLYASGQIAINPSTNEFVLDNIQAETEQVMQNLANVLDAANMGFENVVKCSIFLKNMDQFGEVNDVYAKYFKADPPARETVEVSRLPKDVNVEISLIACKG